MSLMTELVPDSNFIRSKSGVAPEGILAGECLGEVKWLNERT
jgi:hypothetical protein